MLVISRHNIKFIPPIKNSQFSVLQPIDFHVYNFPVKSIFYLLSDGPVWDFSIGFFWLVPVVCFCPFFAKGCSSLVWASIIVPYLRGKVHGSANYQACSRLALLTTSARKEDKNIAFQTETHDVLFKKYHRINKKQK